MNYLAIQKAIDTVGIFESLEKQNDKMNIQNENGTQLWLLSKHRPTLNK